MQKYLEFGRIVTSHGLHGEFKVDLFCDGIEFAAQFSYVYLGTEKKPVKIERLRGMDTQVIVKAEGIDTIEAVKTLLNQILYFSRDDAELPEGVYFESDLIGLEIIDADTGAVYGKLTDIYRTGANDVYGFYDAGGKQKLFPAIREVVISTDLSEGNMKIRPLTGLFDDGVSVKE